MNLYFGAKIDRTTLRAEKVGKAARAIFVTIVSIFAVLGAVVLVMEVWPNLERLVDSGYWRMASQGKLVFAISLFADLYLIARLLRRGEGREGVKLDMRRSDLRSDGGTTSRKRVDVSRALSEDLHARIREAYWLTARIKHAEVGPVHLLWALLRSPSVASLLTRLEIDVKGLQERLKHVLQQYSSPPPQSSPIPAPEQARYGAGKGEETIGNSPPPGGEGQGGGTIFGTAAKQIVIAAYRDAQTARGAQVESYHAFWEAIKAHEGLQEIFFDLGITKDQLKNTVRWFEINDELRRRWHHFRGAAVRRPKGEMNRAMTALQTRFLDRFSEDLTLLAGRGYLPLTVAREKEFDAIFRALQGEQKSILLVGSPGVGKEAILNGIAERMVEEEVPKVLRDRRLVSISLPGIVAGVDASNAEARLLRCLNDVARARNVILAIPRVHGTVGSGAGGLDLAEVLAGEMGKGYFLAIATTTPEEYRARLEGTALGNAFVKVDIGEPAGNETIAILESKVGAIEAEVKVYFSYNALEKAVLLSDRYLKDQYLPEKAIDILKEAAQFARNRRGEKTLVRGEDVAQIVSEKSHVPVTSVTETEADKLVHLEESLHARIVGQDEAVRAVATALRRARAGLREGKRPIANFLFLGPTGVGKTETAKTVAEVYFGGENRMIRLDMSEYQTKDGVARLLGAPGEKGGVLTEPVRKNPFSLVLLDEIEKAHPDILNVFLQIMDDGRATDSAGRVVDFTNTIIIMTSNAGTGFIQETMKQGNKETLNSKDWMENLKRELMERELKQYFKPEFLNRFDGIVVYTPLTEPQIVQIARLVLNKVAKQMEEKGITLRVTEEAIVEIAHAGFDPKFGARPLRRVVQERVQDALANLLLTAKLGRRDVVVLEAGGQLRVEKAEQL